LARASAGQKEARPNAVFPINPPPRNVREPLIGRVINLDESPTPDYSDWFLDRERLEDDYQGKLDDYILPLESSRGCWWSQVAHCVFCGIDDKTLRYRAKSPERVKSMLAEMRRRHGERDFHFSDYILPRTYYKTLLPEEVGNWTEFEPDPTLKLVRKCFAEAAGEDVGQHAYVQVWNLFYARGPKSQTARHLAGEFSDLRRCCSDLLCQPGQINAQAPFELISGNQYQIQVNANGALGTPGTIQVGAATPGVGRCQPAKRSRNMPTTAS
jgi:hypothetical protein